MPPIALTEAQLREVQHAALMVPYDLRSASSNGWRPNYATRIWVMAWCTELFMALPE